MVIDGKEYQVREWTAELQAAYRQKLLEGVLNQLAWTRAGTIFLAETVLDPPPPRDSITEENHAALNEAIRAALKPPSMEGLLEKNAKLKERIRNAAQPAG